MMTAAEWLKATREWDRSGRGYIVKGTGLLELGLSVTLDAYAVHVLTELEVDLRNQANATPEDGMRTWTVIESIADQVADCRKKLRAKQ